MSRPPSIDERDAILADPRAALPRLHQLLGAYFGQDWTADQVRWTEVLDGFVAEASTATVAATAAELRRLLGCAVDEPTLGALLEGLDCALDPRAIGLDAETWLGEVLRRLDG